MYVVGSNIEHTCKERVNTDEKSSNILVFMKRSFQNDKNISGRHMFPVGLFSRPAVRCRSFVCPA